MNAWTVLALAGAFYGVYRALSWNSEYYLQAHKLAHDEIIAAAKACELEGATYVRWHPRGWYEVTAEGAQADAAMIDAYEWCLSALYVKIQHHMRMSPSLWRFRVKDRATFNGNVRQWVVIRNDCVRIKLALNEHRNVSQFDN